jgi:hypothetical protein
MQFRDHEAVKGKRDSYPVDPRAFMLQGFGATEAEAIADLVSVVEDARV